MSRFLAVLQLGLGLLLLIAAATTLINLIFIAPRPETISVVNAIVGQLVVIVCFVALGRILMRRGWSKWKMSGTSQSTEADFQPVASSKLESEDGPSGN